MKVMRGDEGSEIDEYGVSSISFEDKRPFHPQKSMILCILSLMVV